MGEDIFEIEKYKGFIIDECMFGEKGCTVCVEGDEWYFETVEAAREAIDKYIAK